ncbi:unnamed protein product, partial [Mesorhabditis spiculigera]
MILLRRKSRDEELFAANEAAEKKRAKEEKNKKKNAKKMASMPLRKKSQEHNNNVKVRKNSAVATANERKESKRTPTEGSPKSPSNQQRFLPAALRSPTSILRRKKKPLGPSLSWDPERSREGLDAVPAAEERSRIHSDGSEAEAENSDEGDRRSELEQVCPHCALLADYKKKLLKAEIETAVMRLARRLAQNTGRSFSRGDQQSVKSLKIDAPDIVVSSISSDEEDATNETTGSEGQFSSLQTSEARQHGLQLRPPKFLSPFPDSNSPPRSNSVDLSTLRRDIELLSISSGDSEAESSSEFDAPTPADSVRTFRSKSHDPAPSPENLLRRPSRIEHLSELFRKALAKSPVVRRTAEHEHRTVNKHRTSRYWVDEQILAAEHIWLPSSGPGSSSSADNDCYLGDKGGCERTGEKRRCAACHIVAHTACFSILAKLNLNCKLTFRDHGRKPHSTKDLLDGLVMHHWVHKWRHEGRCNRCGKSFQQKIFFHQKEKEPVAVSCSWCKESYHIKNCFDTEKLAEKCNRGSLRDVVIPPGWLLRLPTRKRNKHRHRANGKRPIRAFIAKPIDTHNGSGPSQPLVVFVNPKSGGNKGSKALHTLCWLLNPRQVFDITSLKGPKFGLEVYRKMATQLRLLVCGGDGTVGWVLQTLDQLNWATYPPMALLPLGTGNDLSRCMGWGGSYTDEPLSQLLQAIVHESSVTHLDRWRIDVEPNLSIPPDAPEDMGVAVQSSLPLTVMNNYFSIGADAHVALQFHHSRSANPQMLNSRLKNRIAYGGLGTIDLFKRSWKDLSEYIKLECDGVDLTPKLKELKLHCVLFHNISYYAGGTVPWPADDDSPRPSSCDGKIEVLGFTTATLAALQMGGKGERLAQCSSVRVITTKAIPMQVDGEPCMLAPSSIHLQFHSKVPMLRREKKVVCSPSLRKGTKWNRAEPSHTSTALIMQLPVIVVGRHDYDTYKDAIERLKDTAFEIGMISIEAEMDLVQARQQVHKLLHDHPCLPYEHTQDWRFLDYVTNAEEGTFRVSRHAEYAQSVSDICNPDECLLILDDAFPSITSRGAAIATDLVFSPKMPPQPAIFQMPKQTQPRRASTRRISETLRIVLSSDARETHL